MDSLLLNTLIMVHVVGMLVLVIVFAVRFRKVAKGLEIRSPAQFNAWAQATKALYADGNRLWIAIDQDSRIVATNAAAQSWFEKIVDGPLVGKGLEALDPTFASLGEGEFTFSPNQGAFAHVKLEGCLHTFPGDLDNPESGPIGRVITAVDRTLRSERCEQLSEIVTSLSGLSGDALFESAMASMAPILKSARAFFAAPDITHPRKLDILVESKSEQWAELTLPQHLDLDQTLWNELEQNVCLTYLRNLPVKGLPELQWAQSMVAMTVRDEVNQLLGVVVILSAKPIIDPFYTEDVMRLVIMRLRGELLEKRQTRELQHAHDYYKGVLDSLPVLIWQSKSDLNNRIVFNKTWLDFRGRSANDEDNAGWCDGLHPEDRADTLAELVSFSDARASFEHIYRLKNARGEYRWILELGHPRYEEAAAFQGFYGACTDITERHSAERDLRIFQSAFESTTSGVLLARADGKLNTIKFCNEGFCRLYGLPKDRVIGKSLSEIISCGATPREVDQVQVMFQAGRSGTVEVEVNAIDGQKHWLRSSFTLIEGPTIETPHWVCLVSETTFEKQASLAKEKQNDELSLQLKHHQDTLFVKETELRKQEGERKLFEKKSLLLRSALDHVDIPTVMVQNDGTALIMNEAATSKLQLKPGMVVYRAWQDSLDETPWTPDTWADLLSQLAGKSVDSREVSIEEPNKLDKACTYDIRFKHVFVDGDDFLTCIFVDVSESLEAQGELVAQTDALQKSAEIKSQFVATMSHELRTPLNSILMLTEALLTEVYGRLNATQKKSLKTLEDSGQHLLALINDVLDLSKIEAGKMEIRKEREEILTFCNSILDEFREQAKSDQIDLSFKKDPHIEYVELDKRRFRQILVNLIGNALDFTPKSGVVSLEIIHDDLDDEVTFAVSDTGPGIPANDHTKLFKPFVQLDSGNTRKREGSGLGLSLAREFAELHGGRIEVTSQEGLGSRFSVTIPAPRFNQARDAVEFKSPTPSPFNVEGSLSSEKVILVVDDHAKNRNVVKDFLVNCGYQVLTGSDGRIAVEKAISLNPDVILMDIQMPIMDGYEAMQTIRRDPECGAVGIIAMTALAMEGDKEKCLQAGADDYIAKPIKLSELAERVEAMVKQSA